MSTSAAVLFSQIFANEVELNMPQMIDTITLGEKVRKDPKLTKKSKDEVDEHLDSLSARWDRVKDFMALRKERCVEGWRAKSFNYLFNI